jgi:hypothetical protein
MDTPVLGVQDTYEGPDQWQISTSWRFQKSGRHFVGSDEQEERQDEGSEVVNTIHLLETNIRYNATPRWSFSVGIPYLIAERSNALRGPSREIIGRTTTQARGMGDVTVVARRLMRDPEASPDANISLGFGLKLPTGDNNVVDTRQRVVGGQVVNSVETVDQSIQPGDGGFGFLLEFQGSRRLGHSGLVGYLSAGYLVNPEEENGVATFRNNVGEEFMSVADQYLARVGVGYSSVDWKGWSVTLGGRLEGVPVEDLTGGSEGFRRPGYAVSVEPAVSWSKGAHSISLAVPVALYRNRTRSVPDRAVPGRHGDAAFADYVVMLGYWRRF